MTIRPRGSPTEHEAPALARQDFAKDEGLGTAHLTSQSSPPVNKNPHPAGRIVAYDTRAGGYVSAQEAGRLQRPRFGRLVRAGNVSPRAARRAQERAERKAVRR